MWNIRFIAKHQLSSWMPIYFQNQINRNFLVKLWTETMRWWCGARQLLLKIHWKHTLHRISFATKLKYILDPIILSLPRSRSWNTKYCLPSCLFELIKNRYYCEHCSHSNFIHTSNIFSSVFPFRNFVGNYFLTRKSLGYLHSHSPTSLVLVRSLSLSLFMIECVLFLECKWIRDEQRDWHVAIAKACSYFVTLIIPIRSGRNLKRTYPSV